MTQIAQTGYSRVFTIAGRARPDHAPAYQSLMKAGGVSRDYGDRETIEAPDPNRFGQFITVGSVKGGKKRATTTLTGRYLADVRSELLRLAQIGCPADVQIHFGSCTNPSMFNTFQKAVVLEDADVSSWKTDDLGALESGEQGKVDEQADVSASNVYEIMPIKFTRAADTLLISEIVDIVICGDPTCGECAAENNGNDRIYALATVRTASPGWPTDVIYTLDGGASWNTSRVTTLGATESPNALACIGDYLVVTGHVNGILHYVPLAELDGSGGESWLSLATQFASTHFPNDIAVGQTLAFVACDLGYIYKVGAATDGSTLLEGASVLTAENLLKVSALDDNVVVAVGENNAVLFTLNGETWSSVVGPAVGVNLCAVAVKSAKEWLVGTETGHLYYTNNSGDSWSEKTFVGAGAGKVHDVAYATDSVIYLAHSTAAARGRILRSYDGGYSWNILPENGTLPINQRISCVAPSLYDPNFVAAGGLDSTTGTDGLLLLGGV